MLNREKILPYAAVIIKLLQGTLDADDGCWNILLDYRSAVEEHFGGFGLALRLDETEGYAYLSQPGCEEGDEDDVEALPRLVRRQKLSYGATLLCVLLRERLVRFDQRDVASTRAVVSKADMREMVSLFLDARTDEVKLLGTVDTMIRQVLDLGFLKKLPGEEETFEIRRIIKAKLSADSLTDIKTRLEARADE